MAAGEDLTVPEGIQFNHPYTPYDVQTDFMKTAYGVLQKGGGQVGILESPTGTVGRLGASTSEQLANFE